MNLIIAFENHHAPAEAQIAQCKEEIERLSANFEVIGQVIPYNSEREVDIERPSELVAHEALRFVSDNYSEDDRVVFLVDLDPSGTKGQTDVDYGLNVIKKLTLLMRLAKNADTLPVCQSLEMAYTSEELLGLIGLIRALQRANWDVKSLPQRLLEQTTEEALKEAIRAAIHENSQVADLLKMEQAIELSGDELRSELERISHVLALEDVEGLNFEVSGTHDEFIDVAGFLREEDALTAIVTVYELDSEDLERIWGTQAANQVSIETVSNFNEVKNYLDQRPARPILPVFAKANRLPIATMAASFLTQAPIE